MTLWIGSDISSENRQAQSEPAIDANRSPQASTPLHADIENSSVTNLAHSDFRLSRQDIGAATSDECRSRGDAKVPLGADTAPSWPSAPVTSASHRYVIQSATGFTMLRRAIGGFDDCLSYCCGVKPFTCDERCLLRFAVMASPGAFSLSDGAEVKAGEPMIDLHLWNEHIPPVPSHGADLAWARLVAQRMRHSLVLLAEAVDANPAMLDVKAVRAKTNFVGWGGHSESLSRLIRRFGFEDVDEGSASMPERIHDAFENILIGALTWTHNPEALRRDKLMRQRRPVWMSTETLRRRYAAS